VRGGRTRWFQDYVSKTDKGRRRERGKNAAVSKKTGKETENTSETQKKGGGTE